MAVPWMAIAAATTAVSAGASFLSSRSQASAMQANARRQAQIQRQNAQLQARMLEQQAIMQQQQAQVQGEMFVRQAELNNQMALAQARIANQRTENEAMLIRRRARFEAERKRERAKQAAVAEQRQIGDQMDEQRFRRSRIVGSYAAAGVTLTGTPAEMLVRQRETDAYNVEQAMYAGREARKQLFWEADVSEAVGEEEAIAREYVGSVESVLLKAEAANALATGRMQEASAIYNGAVKANMLKNEAMMTSYAGRVGAQSTRYAGRSRASAMRSQAWGNLASSLGSAAMMSANAFDPGTPTTTQVADVPTGPSYFKAGNPSPTLPTGPAYFRG